MRRFPATPPASRAGARFGIRRAVVALSVGITALVLTACASSGPARWSASSPPPIPRADVLAEADRLIAAGDPAQALVELRPLFGAGLPDPTAHELAGKAYIRLAEFQQAHDAFVLAVRQYDSGTDKRRASDMARFARGLAELEEGDVVGAREQWVEIDHPTLRRAAFDALEDPAEGVALTALDGGSSTASEQEGDR